MNALGLVPPVDSSPENVSLLFSSQSAIGCGNILVICVMPKKDLRFYFAALKLPEHLCLFSMNLQSICSSLKNNFVFYVTAI